MDFLEPQLVLIPGGLFVMGSERGQDDETPPHEVEISPFYLASCPVTNREYRIFLQEASVIPPPSWNDPRFCDPDQPVVAVNWYEARSYCDWLGSLSRKRYRLPAEAEREMACRAGTTTNYPWGDSPQRELGEYGKLWLDGRPEIVGGPPNVFGLCNMADNVHEWCADWYGKDYYRVSRRQNPRGPESGTRRSSRGGSWRHQVKVTRCSARSALDPSFRYTDYGFRLAAS